MVSNDFVSRNWWVPAILACPALVFSYWDTLQALVRQWIENDDYSHGLLIVPIAVYLAWQKRDELRAAQIRSDWRALPLLFLAVFVFVVGELGAELYTTRVSMLIFVIGLTWAFYGPQVVKVLRFPLAFLFLMLPLPGFIYRNITFPLQLSASIGSVKVLQLLGVSVYREGNIIDLGFTQLQVVEACSGLRYVLPLLTLGVLFAYFGQKLPWKRVVLVFATIPIAVFANVLRVAGTGFIGVHWGDRAAEGFFHSFSGWVVFMVCIVFFGLLNFFLKHFPGRPEVPPPAPESPDIEPKRKIAWAPVLASLWIVLLAAPVVAYLGRVPPVPLQKPLTSFPLEFKGYTGEKSSMDPVLWERVGGQEYVIIDYSKENQNPINFYVAYYEYQRKAGDFVHSPRLCLPGAGWFIEKNHARYLPGKSAGGEASEGLRINELVIQKGGVRQLVYFWYQGRSRNFTSEFAAKFYMVWDGLWRRRTDGALVRIITPMDSRRTLEETRSILDLFALGAASALQGYLP